MLNVDGSFGSKKHFSLSFSSFFFRKKNTVGIVTGRRQHFIYFLFPSFFKACEREILDTERNLKRILTWLEGAIRRSGGEKGQDISRTPATRRLTHGQRVVETAVPGGSRVVVVFHLLDFHPARNGCRRRGRRRRRRRG